MSSEIREHVGGVDQSTALLVVIRRLQVSIELGSRTLPEIEKSTPRLVALRMSGDPRRAAEILGMAPVSLSRWIGRRKLPPVFQ